MAESSGFTGRFERTTTTCRRSVAGVGGHPPPGPRAAPGPANERICVMSQEKMPNKPVLIHPMAGKRGMTELHYAAYSNDLDAVRDQLRSGVPVDVRDDNGWTPLHWSIDMAEAWGEPERVVSLLLHAGASANAIDHSGFSVLMMACSRNNLKVLSDLLKAGADIQVRNASSTPLHEAAACNFSAGIRTLLVLGADPSQKDSEGRTPAELAEEYGFEESVAVFRGARPGT